MPERLAVRAGDTHTVAIAVMLCDGNVLTGLRNYTAAVWKDESVWTLPGGRADMGETLEESLRREVAEEVGITQFDIIDFIGELPGAKADDRLFMFACATQQDARLMEPEKFSEWKWITREEYIADTQYSGFNMPARELIVAYLRATATP